MRRRNLRSGIQTRPAVQHQNCRSFFFRHPSPVVKTPSSRCRKCFAVPQERTPCNAKSHSLRYENALLVIVRPLPQMCAAIATDVCGRCRRCVRPLPQHDFHTQTAASLHSNSNVFAPKRQCHCVPMALPLHSNCTVQAMLQLHKRAQKNSSLLRDWSPFINFSEIYYFAISTVARRL